MKLEERNGLRVLRAENGNFLATADKTQVFDSEIYLGKFDSSINYIEVTPYEKGEIMIKLQKREEEERRMMEEQANGEL